MMWGIKFFHDFFTLFYALPAYHFCRDGPEGNKDERRNTSPSRLAPDLDSTATTTRTRSGSMNPIGGRAASMSARFHSAPGTSSSSSAFSSCRPSRVPSYLWRAARAGRITAHRAGPKETRFSVAEARRWGAERTRSRGQRAACAPEPAQLSQCP